MVLNDTIGESGDGGTGLLVLGVAAFGNFALGDVLAVDLRVRELVGEADLRVLGVVSEDSLGILPSGETLPTAGLLDFRFSTVSVLTSGEKPLGEDVFGLLALGVAAFGLLLLGVVPLGLLDLGDTDLGVTIFELSALPGVSFGVLTSEIAVGVTLIDLGDAAFGLVVAAISVLNEDFTGLSVIGVAAFGVIGLGVTALGVVPFGLLALGVAVFGVIAL